jgi:hypothetical protein
MARDAFRKLPPEPVVCPACRYARPHRYYYGGETYVCESCDFDPDGTLSVQAWRTWLNLKLGRPAKWKHYGP